MKLVLSIVILVFGFSLWWLGIRPAQIKSQCTVVQHYKGDIQKAQPASPDWPECLKEAPSTVNEILAKRRDCHDVLLDLPTKDYVGKASNAQYASCLREHGL